MRKFTLASILVFLACQISIQAQNVARNFVVIEIATGTWCTYCPGAAKGVDQLVDEGKLVAVIENHDGDAYSNTYSDARNAYYNPSGVPTGWFDGLSPAVGGVSCAAGGTTYNTYLAKYNTRIAVTSPVTMCISGSNTSGNDYQVSVALDKVGTIAGSDLRLHLALTESHISQSWQGCMTELNFVNRLMVPDANGTTIDFTSGNSQTVNLTFSRNAAWNLDNLELVAFLQSYTSKEIYNATKVKLTELQEGIAPFNLVANQTSGCGPLEVNFSSNASGITSYSWSFPGGIPATSSLPNPTVVYNTPGNYDVSLTVSNGSCSRTVSDAGLISVLESPGVYDITGGGSECGSPSVTGFPVGLTGSQTGTSYALYLDGTLVTTTNGTGNPLSFGNQAGLGSYSVIATKTSSGCTENMTGMVEVGVDPEPPHTPANITGPSTVYITSTPSTEYTTPGATYARAYSWSLTPDYVGTIEGDGTTCNVTWDPLYPKAVTLKVKGINSCGEGVYSQDFPINVYLGVGINEPTETKMLQLVPNPANDVVTIIPSHNMIADVTIINSVGKQEINLSNISLDSGYKLNISRLLPGIYYVRVSNQEINQTLKLVVK